MSLSLKVANKSSKQKEVARSLFTTSSWFKNRALLTSWDLVGKLVSLWRSTTQHQTVKLLPLNPFMLLGRTTSTSEPFTQLAQFVSPMTTTECSRPLVLAVCTMAWACKASVTASQSTQICRIHQSWASKEFHRCIARPCSKSNLQDRLTLHPCSKSSYEWWRADAAKWDTTCCWFLQMEPFMIWKRLRILSLNLLCTLSPSS